jgi:hypothetical protein
MECLDMSNFPKLKRYETMLYNTYQNFDKDYQECLQYIKETHPPYDQSARVSSSTGKPFVIERLSLKPAMETFWQFPEKYDNVSKMTTVGPDILTITFNSSRINSKDEFTSRERQLVLSSAGGIIRYNDDGAIWYNTFLEIFENYTQLSIAEATHGKFYYL